MDDDLLQALEPIKASWQKAECFPPYEFASPSVFRRAFDELFLCREMTIGIMCKVPRTFLSLTGVLRCNTVRMEYLIGQLAVTDVAAWLHREATVETDPYNLEIDGRSVTVESLLDILTEVP